MWAMNITWDARKNRRKVRLHGIAFEDAARVFEGPTLERVDDRFEYGEERICAIGLVDGIERDLCRRRGGERRNCAPSHLGAWSAWKAQEHEREAYWENIGEVGG